MSKKKKSKLYIAIISAVVIIAVAAAVFYLYTLVRNDIDGNEDESISYTLEIEESDFEYEIGQKLYLNGIVIYDSVWTNWMSSHYPDFTYINGEYNLTSDMSYEEIAEKLQNPDVSHKSVKVSIPEGYNAMDIAETLEENGVCSADDFLEACVSADDYDYEFLSDIPDNDLIAYELEGFLFPATYDLAENSEAREVVCDMLDAFEDRLTDEMYEFCDENDMTLYEFLTLASIVQEEALGQESAGNIASVFINRLEKGAKLQSDVTYYYAAALRDERGFSQDVYDAYYTYRCDGLPAGPVSNSGEEIIEAVINHPDTNYLYFFSDLNQEFHFAEDYDTFVELQEEYPWQEDD